MDIVSNAIYISTLPSWIGTTLSSKKFKQWTWLTETTGWHTKCLWSAQTQISIYLTFPPSKAQGPSRKSGWKRASSHGEMEPYSVFWTWQITAVVNSDSCDGLLRTKPIISTVAWRGAGLARQPHPPTHTQLVLTLDGFWRRKSQILIVAAGMSTFQWMASH